MTQIMRSVNCPAGPYITLCGGAMSLAKLENVGALQLFILGESRGMPPQEILGNFRCSKEHSGTF